MQQKEREGKNLWQVCFCGLSDMSRFLFDFQIPEYRTLLILFSARFKGPLPIPHPKLNQKYETKFL